MKLILYLFGAGFELLGIVLMVAPDWIPWASRAGAWVTVRSRLEADRARRLIRRPAPERFVEAEAGVYGVAGVGAGLIVGHDPDAPLEDQVAYLLRRDKASQEVDDRLTDRMTKLETESAERLDGLRREIEAKIADEIKAAAADSRGTRIIGTTALAIGLALTTLANFV